MLRQLVVLTAITAAAHAPAAPRFVMPRLAHESRSPGIRVWTLRSDVYRRGERVRVFYRTERNAYVTIFRIDTDGRLQVLFPRAPNEDNYGYAGATYTVSGFDRGDAFYVDDYPGVGYIFGVASADPFVYDPILSGGRWDVRYASDGRVHGDPRAALEDISAQLLPQGYQDYDTHLVPYYVEQHYDYPRFVCYDCHAYTPYASWDPYAAWCPRYTLVLWNDPYYFYPSYWYPTRYYRGTSVVYVTPGGRTPRYVFTARTTTQAPGIAYRDRRTDSGRDLGRGVRGTDVGGVGSVPPPRDGGRNGGGGVPDRRDKGDNGKGNGGVPGNGGQLGNGGRRGNGGERGRVEDTPGIEIVPRPAEGGDWGRRTPDDKSAASPAPAGTRESIAPTTPSRRELPVLRPAEEARPPRESRPDARPEPPRREAPPAPSARTMPSRESAPPRQAPQASPRQAPPREAAPRQQAPARDGGGGGGRRRP